MFVCFDPPSPHPSPSPILLSANLSVTGLAHSLFSGGGGGGALAAGSGSGGGSSGYGSALNAALNPMAQYHGLLSPFAAVAAANSSQSSNSQQQHSSLGLNQASEYFFFFSCLSSFLPRRRLLGGISESIPGLTGVCPPLLASSDGSNVGIVSINDEMIRIQLYYSASIDRLKQCDATLRALINC